MNTKIKLPNGLEIECAEGAVKSFDLLVNLKQQGFIECNNVEVDSSKFVELETSYNELATKYSKLVESHEELENQMLGNMQNTDVSEDVEKLTKQLELVLKENEELKSEITNKDNYIESINSEITSRDNEIIKLNNAIELLKTQTVEPQIVEVMEKKAVEMINNAKENMQPKVENKTTDFDPNNPKDLEWLKANLNANPVPQVEEVKPVTPSFELPKIQTPQPIQNGEFVDGYLVERNSNGDIIKADGLELMPNECTSIKFGIATVKKVVENRRLIEHGKSQENIATGWGE